MSYASPHSTTTSDSNLISKFEKIAQASIDTLTLTSVMLDFVSEIKYDHGQFLAGGHPVNGPISALRPVAPDELRSLLASLQKQAKQPPADVDTFALETFIHVLSTAVQQAPSGRFKDAAFGDIGKDASGAIVGHYRLRQPIEIAGTIHDAAGNVTVEQHVVPLKPGEFQVLSPADRASLAAALDNYIATAHPRANPLWEQVRQDLK
jgi:hypothetical protein